MFVAVDTRPAGVVAAANSHMTVDYTLLVPQLNTGEETVKVLPFTRYGLLKTENLRLIRSRKRGTFLFQAHIAYLDESLNHQDFMFFIL